MSKSTVRGRYAPSPSGALHAGNLRTALLAWLFARAARGVFLLRVEDLDRPRVRPGATRQMLDDLRWLGLDWDEGPDAGGGFGPYTQSQREPVYAAALARLRARDLLYPCYCTRAEISQIASAPHEGDEPPRYPGVCRDLSPRERAAREAAGRSPSWRFRAPEGMISFTDILAGPVAEDVAATVGDFIVRRSDGVIAYQLAVVVDDALMGVTQVVRGADLLSSTARQIALCRALGYDPPREYAHAPLIVDDSGARLAKRDNSQGLAAARARGMTREDILGALAASLGLWPAGASATLADLLARFDPANVARRPALAPW